MVLDRSDASRGGLIGFEVTPATPGAYTLTYPMGKFILFVLTATALINAQEYRASLLGVVTDSTGAAIVDASIKATNMETAVAASTRTNNDGSYLIPFLLPGRYSLQVEQ